MCGIAGILAPPGSLTGEALHASVLTMTERLAHRGPDDAGSFVDPDAGVALGHRRLAIIDLSAAGHQPMASASGRWVLSFNGEIYDHRRLRRHLEAGGVRFRGTSDTEVLLEAIDRFGLDEALRTVNGMFAAAAWDREQRRLHLFRDRLGEKPLYHGHVGGAFTFGSELKALRALPGFDDTLDERAVASYFRFGWIPAPRSIYRSVSKLPAGSVLTVGRGGEEAVLRRHWSLDEEVVAARAARCERPIEELADELEEQLADAVALRMQADVPVGCFLSGGVDSSLVVALAQRNASGPVRTFTMGVPDERHDESGAAASVASHLGTEHTELHLGPSDTLDLVPSVAATYDEPFGDPSAVPTLLLAAATREHVKVVLSGDGGDELFRGYNRQALADALWRRIRRVPPVLRSGAASVLATQPPARWERVAETLAPALPAGLRVRNVGDKVSRLTALLRVRSPDELTEALVTVWSNGLLRSHPSPEPFATAAALDDPVERLAFHDLAMTLPDDMLVKVDRATMAVGLEARLPLLDPRLLRFAWSLPRSALVSGGRGKLVLRRVLERHVPAALVDRPKMGFDPPIGAWLRGPLRAWAEDLLDTEALERDGLDADVVHDLWRRHGSGAVNADYQLWTVVAFRAWREAAA
jgi:asparagine synthase (glutamine-hydrolysing)